MAKIKGGVRTAQLITTYGVGAVVAVEDESFMIAGIDRWTVDEPDIHEPRLERRLDVRGFCRPPASDKGLDIPVVRFPKFYSCPSCKRLNEHRFFVSGWDDNTCNKCSVELVPSRFIVACAAGHVDDFPYFRWVHTGRPDDADGRKHQLSIRSTGATASLSDIVIECACGANRSMEGAFSRIALKGVSRCKGNRPWLSGNESDTCDQPPRTLQRGASNVWFPVLASAISIPPWSEGAYKIIGANWKVIRSIPESALAATITGMGIAEGTGFSVDDLVSAVQLRKREAEGELQEEPLKDQEFVALLKGREETSREQDFVCEKAPLGPTVARYFSQVMQVKRLREVRALTAFTRVLPPEGDDHAREAPLAAQSVGWLPAIDVRGEGVFMRFDEDRLTSWEARPEVIKRVAVIDGHYRDRAKARKQPPDRSITPRLVLVHTFAHALINQWALDAGYSASSLRERLYVTPTGLGALIYTATSDSAGSLGGVVAQARPERLDETLIEAMSRAAWCSADPLCIEASTSGVDSLNLAACHACVLLPETSCEEMNLLLDRALLVGTPEEPSLAYFAELVD